VGSGGEGHSACGVRTGAVVVPGDVWHFSAFASEESLPFVPAPGFADLVAHGLACLLCDRFEVQGSYAWVVPLPLRCFRPSDGSHP
jgi:hypothetical protein